MPPKKATSVKQGDHPPYKDMITAAITTVCKHKKLVNFVFSIKNKNQNKTKQKSKQTKERKKENKKYTIFRANYSS